MKSKIVAFLALVLSPAIAFGQDNPTQSVPTDILITGSRFSIPRTEDGSSSSVYTSADIENTKEVSVVETLRHIPGVDVVQSGGAGGNSAVFIRGANSEHTLVLLDGIELNNPASTNRAFNFANLTLEDIDRIEVVRGTQSTIYGSDAIGGVINIITKKGSGPLKVSASTEAGSYDSFNQKAGISGGDEKFSYSAGVNRQDTGGISAAGANYGNSEHDAYHNTSGTARLAFQPDKFLSAEVSGRYSSANGDIDDSGGVGGDDPNRKLDNDEGYVKGTVASHFFDDTLSQEATINYSHHDLTDNNNPDNLHPTELLRSSYTGSILKVSGHNRWQPYKEFGLISGLETEQEKANSDYFSDGDFGPFEDNLTDKEARTNGYFTESKLAFEDRYFATAGIRVDNHSEFGTRTTFRLAPAVVLSETGTTFRGSVGTGYKAPSLVQLYSSYGDPDLEPEKSVGWDIGVEQNLIEDQFDIAVTFFHNQIENLVTFNSSTFLLENINEATTEGFEVTGKYTFCDSLVFNTSYTYTDTNDDLTDESLLRRPRNKFGVDIDYSPIEKLHTHLFVNWIGDRFDNDYSTFEPVRTRLSSYTLVNVTTNYQLTEKVELFAKVENLFDKEYEDVLGYGTPGASGFGGVKVTL